MNIIEALEIGESLCASEAEEVLANEVRNLRAVLYEERMFLAWCVNHGASLVVVSEAEAGIEYHRNGKKLHVFDAGRTYREVLRELIAAEAAGGGK